MKPVLLFFFANDVEAAGEYLRNLASEADAIHDALSSVDEMCEVVITKNTTAEKIWKLLSQYRHRVAVLHYAGHAESLQLMLESADGSKHGFQSETLAEYLKNQDNLELVFLNGCSTDDQVERLINAGVPYVIATSKAIDDQVATKLSTMFYQGLASGSNIDVAWNEAKAGTRDQALNSPRGFYFPDAIEKMPVLKQQFPWKLMARPGLDPQSRWNLPEASNNPLLGLPDLPAELKRFPEDPYQHLQRFTRDKASIFFGRGREILQMYNEVTNPTNVPLILYYGQSGVGKSSLLDAGLLPRLQNDFHIEYIRRSSAGSVHDVLGLLGVDDASDSEALTGAWCALENDKPLVLVLDQLEEAFAQANHASGKRELDQLGKLMNLIFHDGSNRPKGKVILAFRKEWLSEIEDAFKQHRVSRTSIFLQRLSELGVQEAICLSEKARQHYRLCIDDGLAEKMAGPLVEDHQSPLAPTLQILLTNLWNQAVDDNRGQPKITHQMYQDLRRSGIQMVHFLDSQIKTVAASCPEAEKSGQLLSILDFHCSELNTSQSRTRLERANHFGENLQQCESIIALCKQHRLLTDPADDNADSDQQTRLSHDTLAPLIRVRVEESNRTTQVAERILSFHRPASLDDQQPLLDARELKLLNRAKPHMRSLAKEEQQLLEDSQDNLRARSRTKYFLAAGVGVLLLATIWFMQQRTREAEISRRADVLLSAEPDGIHDNLQNFGQHPNWTSEAIRRVTSKLDQLSPAKQERTNLNVALLNAWTGQANFDKLSAALSNIYDCQQLILFSDAWKTAASDLSVESTQAITQLIGDTEDEADRARVAWFLALADFQKMVPEEWFRPHSQPDDRTRTIKEMGSWTYLDTLDSSEALFEVMKAPGRHWFKAAQCQALWHMVRRQRPPESKIQSVVDAVMPLVTHQKIAVRSSALAVLAGLEKKDEVFPADQIDVHEGDDWFALYVDFNHFGQTKQVVIDFAKVELDRGKSCWLSTTEVPRVVMEQAISQGTRNAQQKVFDRRKGSHANPSSFDRDIGLFYGNARNPSAGARFLTWSECLGVCNWLNSKVMTDSGATYERNDSSREWRFANRDGFRLPLSHEWRTAAAASAGLTSKYSFGDVEHFEDFGCSIENSNGVAELIGSKLPNAYGFFDMHGNLQEWCWPGRTAGPETGQPWELVKETIEIQTQDGTFNKRRERTVLHKHGDTVAGTERHLEMGFRFAISKKPQSELLTSLRESQ